MTESQLDEVADVASVVSRCLSDLEPVFEQIDWAEDEIARAQRHHPATATPSTTRSHC
ncbi:hypothetical protein [Nocardia violaceofusca]|uniref:hypothetical protein n=1 Tax=Nocardia violaceofusca TaxID=941182 RepID=UPI0012F4921A|nr:hypothetical protein [Nocardia violaceofusca]